MTTDYKGWPQEDVERRARAIAERNEPGLWDKVESGQTPRALLQWKHGYIADAIATLEADEAAGKVLVPREATEEMADAFSRSSMGKMTQKNIQRRINAAIEAGRTRKE